MLFAQDTAASPDDPRVLTPLSKGVVILLVLIVFLGLYLRLTMVSHTQMDTPIRNDAKDYTAYAYNLRLHGVYSKDINGLKNMETAPKPDAVRSPGYPFFLLPFAMTNDLSLFAVNVFYVQAMLSTLMIIIVFFLSRPLVGNAGSLIASALVAMSPHMVTANIYLLTETLFAFSAVLFLFFLMKVVYSEKWQVFILAGIVLGYGVLVRPTIQYVIIFFLVFFALDHSLKHKKKVILALTLPFALILSVWFLRNVMVIGSLSDPTLTINTIHHGMYPDFMFNGQPHTFGIPYRFDPESPEISKSLHTVLRTVATRFLDAPGTYLHWFLSKPLRLFQWSLVQGHDIYVYPLMASPYHTEPELLFKATYAGMRVLHPILVFLSFVGMVIPWLSDRRITMTPQQRFVFRILSLFYFYFILVHMVGAPFPRYSVPIRPVTYLLAVAACWIAIPFFIRKKHLKKAAQ